MEDTRSILSAEFPHISPDTIDLIMVVSNNLTDARATLMANSISQELGATHTSIDPPIVEHDVVEPIDVEPEQALTPIGGLLQELELQAQQNFATALNVLRIILRNLLEFPDQEKYRRIKTNNANFASKVGRFPPAMKILEQIGFIEIGDDELVICDLQVDTLQEALSLVEALRSQQQEPPQVEPSPARPSPPAQPAAAPPRQALSKREQIALANEARMLRLQSGLPAEVTSSQDDPSKYRGVYKLDRGNPDLTAYRARQRDKWKGQRPKQMTLNEIQALRQDTESRYIPPSKSTEHAIGVKSFELTNEFRKSQGLQPLIWNERMCEIGVVHSKDMGEGKVPFGHQGFNGRYQQFPFSSTQSGGENVAWSKGHSEVAMTAVNGWINSPGHRKNMLGNFNYSGIGVYTTTDGRTYLTQLFARAQQYY